MNLLVREERYFYYYRGEGNALEYLRSYISNWRKTAKKETKRFQSLSSEIKF
jgi:hypothetical protein